MIMGTHFSRQLGSWRLQRGTSSLHEQVRHAGLCQQHHSAAVKYQHGMCNA
jgi:hypothetical protein